VNLLHPAYPKSKWLQFSTDNILTGQSDSGTLTGRIRYTWADSSSCGRLVGQTSAFWLSDTSGTVSKDLYVEHQFSLVSGESDNAGASGCSVARRPQGSLSLFAALAALAALALLRRRRPA